MSPKIIDKEQRKKEIALVALDLIADKGFEATSISSVAKAAGIGKGTIYEYFSSKEELVTCAFVVWIENMMGDESEEMLRSIPHPEERLRTFIESMMQMFVSDERTIKLMIIMFQMMLQSDKLFPQNQEFRKIFQMMRKIFIDIVLDGVSQGVFRPEIARDAEKIAINLFAYLDGIAFHYYLNKEDIELMSQVNFYLDDLIENLRKA